ncbi:PBP1A family penicillin-binding protein [Marinococcus halophilus]|uniref:PBP1A family penicillin-binding protein n=1 Tax=Marinococcus halophilus TaxID=1371 RepID=UPI0015C45976|nr:PBP1A family penicillin-binding protein [Marinococcus halophilus]
MSDNYRSRREKRTADQKNPKNKQKKKRKRPLWQTFIIWALSLMLVFMTAVVIIVAYMINQAPELDAEAIVLSEAATVYDQNDEEIAQLQNSSNRELADIEEMPDYAKEAFIAVEDERFYSHFGIDVQRIFGALWANVTDGFGSQGASTITQQVVKNAFLSPDKNISRKVQEQYLAIKLEQQYSKDEILEMYVNLIYFNQGAYGITQAGQTYFGKEEPGELTIADAALLAAIPRRPTYYDPVQNPENAEERRNQIISMMNEQGYITDEEAEEASSTPVDEQLNYQPPENGAAYDSFMSYVQNELEDFDGIEASDIYTAGLKVYTTLDTEAQEQAEELIQSPEALASFPDNEEFQIGFTLLDTQTGAVKAIVGNRQSPDTAMSYNFATDPNQPGSTIKPVLDYGPAIENMQWSTYHQIEDEEYQYPDTDTDVRNYTRDYRGSVSMREALTDSLNVPAVKTLEEVGLDNARSFANGLGLGLEDVYYGSALGGLEQGVSSEQMAGAYAAFGNEGVYNDPHSIRRIEFPDGRTIDFEPEQEQAMEDYTAYMITDMLKDVISEGTGTGAQIDGLPLAGKTGTTNFTEDEMNSLNIPDGGVPDVWFNGYTTNYTASVWAGFESRSENNYLVDGQTEAAKDVFREIMQQVSSGIDTPDFEQPDSVVTVQLNEQTGERATSSTPDAETITELFVEGEVDVQVTEPSSENESENGRAPENEEPAEDNSSDETEDSQSDPEPAEEPAEEAEENPEDTPEENPEQSPEESGGTEEETPAEEDSGTTEEGREEETDTGSEAPAESESDAGGESGTGGNNGDEDTGDSPPESETSEPAEPEDSASEPEEEAQTNE